MLLPNCRSAQCTLMTSWLVMENSCWQILWWISHRTWWLFLSSVARPVHYSIYMCSLGWKTDPCSHALGHWLALPKHILCMHKVKLVLVLFTARSRLCSWSRGNTKVFTVWYRDLYQDFSLQNGAGQDQEHDKSKSDGLYFFFGHRGNKTA